MFLCGSWVGFLKSVVFCLAVAMCWWHFSKGLVQEYGWLTQQQLLDAIAIGQFTPGPVLSTCTFIGYIIAGVPGAIVATVGIFLPSFFFVAALNPLIPRLRGAKWTKAFLDSINVSALALMAVVTLQLGIATLTIPKPPFVDFLAVAITIVLAVLVIRFSINAASIVLGAALIGWGLYFRLHPMKLSRHSNPHVGFRF
jgi:chromate transporter